MSATKETVQSKVQSSVDTKVIKDKFPTVHDFEQDRLAYIENLKKLVNQVMDPKTGSFKIEESLKNDPEILRDVVHTLLGSFRGDQSRFLEYIKYKKKGSGTDYRVPIRKVVFNVKERREALENLLKHKEFNKEDLGRDRVLVAQFPDLTRTEFNLMVGDSIEGSNQENSPIVKQIASYEKRCLILHLRSSTAKTIDLHGFDKKSAQDICNDHALSEYSRFKNRVSFMTGKGNHTKPEKLKNGMSPLKIATLHSMENLDNQGAVNLKSCNVIPDGVIAKFHSPAVVTEKDLPKAIREKNDRVIVELDKEYSPAELDKRAFLLIAQKIMGDRTGTLVATWAPQEKTDSNRVNLHFSYKKPVCQFFQLVKQGSTKSLVAIPK